MRVGNLGGTVCAVAILVAAELVAAEYRLERQGEKWVAFADGRRFAVLSPADGIVAANEEVLEDEYFHEKRRQLSIFMSIYDVHINFFPFDGEVTYYKYHPGKFLLAFNPKSSTDNEHNTIILKDTKGREILVRQIAGFVARRIVCALEPGDQAVVGEELGMIRFGSRVDVFLPLDAEIKVKIGDKTTGKETVLAILK